MDKKDFAKIWQEAENAGKTAATNCVVVPMIVEQHENILDDNSPVKKQWVVDDGVCGFASVTIRPGNCTFANWLKKMGYAKINHYSGGVYIWISEYNQSMTRKEAHAIAMCDVFRKYGINANWDSRMD